MKHELFMQRCLQLAENGKGTVSPNPLVGSVIVHNDQIIGEGWHQKSGEPHAEVNAINAVRNPNLLKEATIYINLEPCAHFGKTPPCADLVIEKGIPRVVIGTRDPFAKVNGQGIAKMREAGIEVTENILSAHCLEMNKRFFTFHQKRRPYIILKWAQTMDGFIDRERNEVKRVQNKITGEAASLYVHKMRSEEDAILVGTNTAYNDDPSLTTRTVEGKNPIRLLIDRNLKISKDSAIFSSDARTLVYNLHKGDEHENVQFVKVPEEDSFIPYILGDCYKKNIQSIIVEGGTHTISKFLESNNWDEIHLLVGPEIFSKGLKGPQLPDTGPDVKLLGKDTLYLFKNI